MKTNPLSRPALIEIENKTNFEPSKQKSTAQILEKDSTHTSKTFPISVFNSTSGIVLPTVSTAHEVKSCDNVLFNTNKNIHAQSNNQFSESLSQTDPENRFCLHDLICVMQGFKGKSITLDERTREFICDDQSANPFAIDSACQIGLMITQLNIFMREQESSFSDCFISKVLCRYICSIKKAKFNMISGDFVERQFDEGKLPFVKFVGRFLNINLLGIYSVG